MAGLNWYADDGATAVETVTATTNDVTHLANYPNYPNYPDYQFYTYTPGQTGTYADSMVSSYNGSVLTEDSIRAMIDKRLDERLGVSSFDARLRLKFPVNTFADQMKVV